MRIRLRRIGAIARNEWSHIVSRPYTVFRVVIFPVTEVLVYALITRYLITGTFRDTAGPFMVMGTITWILINEFQRGISLAAFDLLYEHNLAAVWTTPVRLWEWFAGAVASATLIAGATATVILASAAALGMPIGQLGWWAIPTVAIAAMLAFALNALVFICVMRWGFGAAELAWGLGAMLSPLSGAFVPVSALPTVLQPIASVLPTTMLFSAMREAWYGTGNPAGLYAAAFVVAVAAVAIMLAALRLSFRRFRARVKITSFI